MTKQAVYGRDKEGPFKGMLNGERKYVVDMSNALCDMGTYHYLGGNKVKIIYRGNKRTCEKCHQTASECTGRGIAKECTSDRIPLDQHMTNMMRKIGRLQLNKNVEKSPKGHEIRHQDIQTDNDENSESHKVIKDKTKEKDQKENSDTVNNMSGACGTAEDMIKDREQTRTSTSKKNLKERIERFNETMKKHEEFELTSMNEVDNIESEKNKTLNKSTLIGDYEEASESAIDKLEAERAMLKL